MAWVIMRQSPSRADCIGQTKAGTQLKIFALACNLVYKTNLAAKKMRAACDIHAEAIIGSGGDPRAKFFRPAA